MSLEEFAKQAGVALVDCGPGWGGRIGYRTRDYPNTTVCGFRSESSAYKEWARATFGENTAKALIKLLANAPHRTDKA